MLTEKMMTQVIMTLSVNGLLSITQLFVSCLFFIAEIKKLLITFVF